MNPNTIAGLWLALVALMGTCLYLAHRLYRANPGAVVADNDAGELSALVEKLDGELFDARTANASLAADVRQAIEQRDRLVRKYGVVRRKFRRERRRYTRVERALHAKSVELAEMKERAGITH